MLCETVARHTGIMTIYNIVELHQKMRKHQGSRLAKV